MIRLRAYIVLAVALAADYTPTDKNAILPFAVFSANLKVLGDSSKSSFSKASQIFETGTANDCWSTFPRTASELSLLDTEGPYFNAFKSFYGKPYSWNSFLKKNLNDTLSSGEDSVIREYNIKKGTYGLLAMHMVDALYEAVDLANKGDQCAKFAWDKAWAYFYGQDGKASVSEVANKRDTDFPDGMLVFPRMYNLFLSGAQALADKENFDTDSAEEARDAIARLLTVTFVRAAVKYSYKIFEEKGKYLPKYHAEGYAYWRVASAWVAKYELSAMSQDTNTWIIEDALAISQTDFKGAHCKVVSAAEAIYQAVGIDCEIVGAWKDSPGDCTACSVVPAKAIPAGLQSNLSYAAICSTGEQWFDGLGCTDCPLGTFNPKSNGECRSCADGSFASETGSVECSLCPTGTFSSKTTDFTRISVCEPCGEGFYAPVEGSTKCTFQDLLSANEEQQRIFWGLCICTTLLGLIVSSYIMYAFATTPALQKGIMFGFLAMLIPDFLYCLLYFPIYLRNVLTASMIPAGACQFVAFVHYGIVIATFCAPVTISFSTYRATSDLVNNRLTNPGLSIRHMILLLAAPWAVGFILAAIVHSQGHLGSYRGLYCYAQEWDHVLTGGATIFFLCASSLTTIYFYFRVGQQIDKLKKSKQKMVKRGLLLVGAVLGTWATFAVAGFMHLTGNTPSVGAEITGGILISIQTLVDAAILFSIPAFRDKVLSGLSLASTTASNTPKPFMVRRLCKCAPCDCEAKQ